MRRKLRKKKSAPVIVLSDNLKMRLVPACLAGLLLAVAAAVVIALLFSLYQFWVSKSPSVGTVIPILLYIVFVTIGSYLAANYFDTRSLIPSLSVGGLFLLMSLTYTLSAEGLAGLGGAVIPLKLLFTLIGLFLGYFLVDIIYISWLPVREQYDNYFIDDEYENRAETNYNAYQPTNGYYGEENHYPKDE